MPAWPVHCWWGVGKESVDSLLKSICPGSLLLVFSCRASTSMDLLVLFAYG